MQLDVARTIYGARKGTSTVAVLGELNWQSLKARREFLKLRHFSKVVDKCAPSYLSDLIPSNTPGNRVLRNQNNIRSIKCRTETFISSYIPASTSIWNDLPLDNRNRQFFTESLRSHKSPELFNHGAREVSIKMAQLRMNCSKLNAHLFSLHVVESAACSCGFDCEDTNHFLFHCPLYIVERNLLFTLLRNLGFTMSTKEILTQGDPLQSLESNKEMFNCMFQYIEETKRL